MLQELSIANIAIIERQSVRFSPGLTVITGETGAGKSILIDALGLALGAKADTELVRAGAASAHVEAMFTLAVDGDGRIEGDLQAVLDDLGVEAEDGVLLLSRDLNLGGRSVARVNGRMVVASALARLGERLVDIHGQSDHLSLLRPAEHIGFLDRYAGLFPLRAEVAAAVTALRRVREERARLERAERDAGQRADLLRFQIDEIIAANPAPGEAEALTEEIALLANAEQRARLANAVYAALAAGLGAAPGATDLLGRALADVRELSRLDPRLADTAIALEGLSYQLEDVARGLRLYRDTIEFDPARLQAASERLDALRTLARKYGGTIEAALAHRDAAAAELEALEHRQERLDELAAQEEAALAQVGERAGALSRARQEAARALAEAIERELAELNMGRARFAVSITQRPDPRGAPVQPAPGEAVERFDFDATGIDTVEFLLSVNAGEPLRPLAKVASGGETSRVMLALKTVLSRADVVGTLIFDEVDTGLGGQTGYVVGQKLARLGREHQVVAITHLPQIAAFADEHLAIAKDDAHGRTTTVVRRLRDDERADEIARMIGGLTRAARQAAQDLLQRARRDKGGAAVAPDGNAAQGALPLGNLFSEA